MFSNIIPAESSDTRSIYPGVQGPYVSDLHVSISFLPVLLFVGEQYRFRPNKQYECTATNDPWHSSNRSCGKFTFQTFTSKFILIQNLPYYESSGASVPSAPFAENVNINVTYSLSHFVVKC